MILYLTRGVARLALRVHELNQMGRITSHEDIQFVIQPGQWDMDCGPNGSPWILTGCWPGKITDVDIANPPQPDFPALIYDCFETDADGRLVFLMDERLWRMPNGRYSGTIQVRPHVQPFTMTPFVLPKPEERDIPAEYKIGRDCEPQFPKPVLPPPPPRCCVLARFDIDLGPECSDHYIDQITVDMRDGCGIDEGE